jgi:hypothetical protein
MIGLCRAIMTGLGIIPMMRIDQSWRSATLDQHNLAKIAIFAT